MGLIEDLNQISVDSGKLHDVVHGMIDEVVETEGGDLITVATAINDIINFQMKGNWTTSTAYAIKDVVLYSGILYVVTSAHTSGTFATDLSNNLLAVYQNSGIKKVDGLAALKTTLGTTTPIVYLSYLNSSSDQGGGLFFWNPTSVETENDVTIVAVTGIGTGRWLRDYKVLDVKMFGAMGDGVTTNTTALEAPFEMSSVYKNGGGQWVYDGENAMHIPKGRYLYSGDGIVLQPFSKVTGDGVNRFYFEPEDAGVGSCIVQTTANPVFTTDIGDIDASYFGHMRLRDFSVFGGRVGSYLGTYGIYCDSTSNNMISDVWAQFFTLTGMYFYGCLKIQISKCSIDYCRDCGIDMVYGPFGTAESTNAYMSSISDTQLHQNGNCGIRLGVSTVRVEIRGCDIESTGSYFAANGYPNVKGYGIYLSSEAWVTVIEKCWFESNKYHIVVGEDSSTPSVSTVPRNTLITNNEFWSVTNDDNIRIVLNTGIGTQIVNNHFFGGGKIKIGAFAGNPILRDNWSKDGHMTIIDSNGNDVKYITESPQINSTGMTPDLLYPNLWDFDNCTVEVDYTQTSPGGMVPVYKVTPTVAGSVQISLVQDSHTWLQNRHTFCWYMKRTAGEDAIDVVLGVAQVSPLKVYTSSSQDIHALTDEWTHNSIGRHVDEADVGNHTVVLSFTADNVTPVYISSLVAIEGIYNEEYRHSPAQMVDFPRPSDNIASVYGIETATTLSEWEYIAFKNGAKGQEIRILVQHALTFYHHATGGNLYLKGGIDATAPVGSYISFICTSTGDWYETSRSF